ncbi:MAG: hypothetical protein AAGB51_14270 [Planctomycetota bacterium]
MPDDQPNVLPSDASQPDQLDRVLIDAYQAKNVPLDQLPYSDDLGEFVRVAQAVNPALDNRETLKRLLRLRKAGRLPRLGQQRAWTSGLSIDDEVRLRLLYMIEARMGSIGLRDRLPYTEDFEELFDQFSKETSFDGDKRDFWRLISTLGKRGGAGGVS